MSASVQTNHNKASTAMLDEHSTVVEAVRRILLVDEQVHVLRVIRMNLERCGYLVDAVLSAELALQHVRAHHYDALVMTSDLPDMTSGRLCKRTQVLLNDCNPHRHKPLILVGRDTDSDWIEEADYCEPLSRPVSLKLILARLGRHFEASACHAAECH